MDPCGGIVDHFLNCLDAGGGGVSKGTFPWDNPMMQAHNGTLWNPSWKAVEMSQRAVPWSAFILTEHSKTHHAGLSRFAGISTIWGVSKLETLPNPNRSLAGMYRWCQHLTAKFNSFVVFRAVATQRPCLCSEKFHRSFFKRRAPLMRATRFYEEKLWKFQSRFRETLES